MTAGYSLATLAGPIFTILLTPLYTRVLVPADYALLDTATTIGLLALALGSLGLGTAVAILYHGEGGTGDEAQAAAHGRAVMGTAAALGALWSAALALGLVAAARPLAQFALGSADQAVLLYLTALNLPIAVFSTLGQTGMRLRMEVAKATALALLNIVLTPALVVLFVVVWRRGVLGVQIATVLVTLTIAVATLALTWRAGWGRPTPALVAPLLRLGLAYLPGSMSAWALSYADRLILPLFGVALADRGLYAIANKLASMLAIVTVPFQNAWTPLALASRDAPEAPRTYAKVLTFFTAGGLGLALALGLFAREILLVFTTPVYAVAAPYVGPLAYVVIANGASVAVGVGSYLTRRAGTLGWSLGAGAALNVALNLLLIPQFGVWGAVWATVLGYMATPVVLYVMSQRAYPIPFELAKVLAAVGLQAALLFGGSALSTGSPWLDVAMKLLLLLMYPAGLLLLGVLEPHEAKAVLDLARRPRAALAAIVRR